MVEWAFCQQSHHNSWFVGLPPSLTSTYRPDRTQTVHNHNNFVLFHKYPSMHPQNQDESQKCHFQGNRHHIRSGAPSACLEHQVTSRQESIQERRSRWMRAASSSSCPWFSSSSWSSSDSNPRDSEKEIMIVMVVALPPHGARLGPQPRCGWETTLTRHSITYEIPFSYKKYVRWCDASFYVYRYVCVCVCLRHIVTTDAVLSWL